MGKREELSSDFSPSVKRLYDIAIDRNGAGGHTVDTEMFIGEMSSPVPHVDAKFRIGHDSFDLLTPLRNIRWCAKIAIQSMLYCFSYAADIADTATETGPHRLKKRQRHALKP